MSPSYETVASALSLLAPADRHWVLSRLDEERRKQLAELLDGASPDGRTPVLNVPGRSTLPAPQATDVGVSALIDEIERMSLEELLALWRGAHTGLLRCFIAIYPWRCADALRQLAGGSGTATPMPDLPAALRRAVLESVVSAARRTRGDRAA